jgi:hypothetical protein
MNSEKYAQYIQLSFLQAADLRHSLLRTFYPAYAVFLYNGGLAFTYDSGTHTMKLTNTNVTVFEVNTFDSGDITSWIPGVILIILGCW